MKFKATVGDLGCGCLGLAAFWLGRQFTGITQYIAGNKHVDGGFTQ